MTMMDLSGFVAPDTATAAIVEAVVKVIDNTERIDEAVLAHFLGQCGAQNEFQLLQAASSLLQAAMTAS